MMTDAVSLPEGFIARLTAENPVLFANLADALMTPPEVAVRYNRGKVNALPSGDAVPWCDAGRYLAERPVFTLDPALHQGLYYVQDPSSMFMGRVARRIADEAGRPLAWLDACAAPGGKTTAVLDSLPSGSLVVANEIVPQRAAALRENLIKWGNPGVIVTRGDHTALSRLRGRFDVVAADVPCSGEGMMRKEPEAVAQWSPALVTQCAARQREIVEALWSALAPGGWFIYSTCTFNTEENERNAAFIVDELGGEPADIGPTPSEWGIDGESHMRRFIPGRVRGEGLFIALFRKPGTLRAPARARSPRGADLPMLRRWIAGPEGAPLVLTVSADRINAFPAQHLELLGQIEHTRGLDVILHGTIVAIVKGRDYIPHHSLAMSTALRPDAFERAEIADAAGALDYLRLNPVSLPAGVAPGYVLLTYGGHPLGFVKNLGNRINTLYPKEYRIHI